MVKELTHFFTSIISETNGISLEDTLELMTSYHVEQVSARAVKSVADFRERLLAYQISKADIRALLDHPVSAALFQFFQHFPLKYREDHTHLTGALTADFVYPRLKKLLVGKNGKRIKEQIEHVYGPGSAHIRSKADVDKLIRLQKNEYFDRYLQIVFLTKLVLTNRTAHKEAAYFLANELYTKYNVGHVRLKFTLSRKNSTRESEIIPGIERLTPEDVVLGLYDGFAQFQRAHPDFNFILSPVFRKEPDYFDQSRFATKKEDVEDQVNAMLQMIERHPQLRDHLCEIDTVGDEKYFYRKQHYLDMTKAFRKLQFAGFRIRSHHGETWKTLRRGIQAVDNAMNIWHIDSLEHGLALGVNPNYYFHSLFQRVVQWNIDGRALKEGTIEYDEVMEMGWYDDDLGVRDKLIAGQRLSYTEMITFTKAKFHTAREVEHYQHDILNRMINKQVSLVSLPSSNFRLTHFVPDFKDHPFSWWEKKGLQLGVGTDNYVTLNTNYIREMLILLYTDAEYLKITKLLMVTTGETRRPYISSRLWEMRKIFNVD
ncbi:MAG: hypothetical protein HYV32_01145 [Candidatus Kerfeldbacteria bacterium]|nr:hypothetical protein [Candidatus Kerfeldbacteria bacterium]